VKNRPLIALTILSLAIAGWAMSRRDQRVPPTAPADPEHLLLEAATFYDPDTTHARVSEARAISDMLKVATYPDSKLVRALVQKYSAFTGFDHRDRMWAASAIGDLAFTYSNDRPGLLSFTVVRVKAGQLRLFKPDLGENGSSFGPPGLNDQEEARKELGPFLHQILSPAGYAADRRSKAELEPDPAQSKPDPAVVGRLYGLMEKAKADYRGYAGDNRRFVARVLQIAMCDDIEAIHDAGAKLIEKYPDSSGRPSDDVKAAVLDCLPELLFDKAICASPKNWPFEALIETSGVLATNPKLVHLPMDSYQWPSDIELDRTLWRRRDLTKYRAQAAIR
jgi:hypothetical protein